MSKGFKKIIEKLFGSLDEKKEWNNYRKRVKELPDNYKKVMEGVQTYMFDFAGGPATMEVLYNVLEMFEEGAMAKKSPKDIIGDDIGEFCEEIFRAVPDATWVAGYKKKIQNRVNKSLE